MLTKTNKYSKFISLSLILCLGFVSGSILSKKIFNKSIKYCGLIDVTYVNGESPLILFNIEDESILKGKDRYAVVKVVHKNVNGRRK